MVPQESRREMHTNRSPVIARKLPVEWKGVGSDISNKAVSFDIRTVGKTTRKPHKMSYLTVLQMKVMAHILLSVKRIHARARRWTIQQQPLLQESLNAEYIGERSSCS